MLVNLSLDDKKILVVGGGSVALRKTKKLLAYSQNITIVSPKYLKEFTNLNIALIKDTFKNIYLSNIDIVFLCTNNNELHNKIIENAKNKKIIFNNSTSQTNMDFAMAASFDYEGYSIALTSTNGVIANKKIKNELEQLLRRETMDITTKKGDDGMTDVIGERRLKCDERIEAYGCVDELSTQVGMLHYLLSDPEQLEQLEVIMDLIRNICRDLANVSLEKPYYITSEDLIIIDDYAITTRKNISHLTLFQRPIGNQIFHHANIVRAKTRTCERRIIKLKQQETINKEICPLINRLSDYFFLLAKLNNEKK